MEILDVSDPQEVPNATFGRYELGLDFLGYERDSANWLYTASNNNHRWLMLAWFEKCKVLWRRNGGEFWPKGCSCSMIEYRSTYHTNFYSCLWFPATRPPSLQHRPDPERQLSFLKLESLACVVAAMRMMRSLQRGQWSLPSPAIGRLL